MYAVREGATEMLEPDPVDVHVGRRIWQRRRAMGLSRRALGERIGIGLKQVNKYETAVNRVSAGRLYDIAVVMGVTPSYFFDGYDDGKAGESGESDPGDPQRYGSPREIRTLVNAYHSLAPDIRSRFLRLTRVIADID